MGKAWHGNERNGVGVAEEGSDGLRPIDNKGGIALKICIPTASKNGMSAKVYGHFGSAPFFMIFDTKTDKIEIIDNANYHHTHGTCQPMDAISGKNITAVICGGMGARAVNKLNEAGIKVFRSSGMTVKDAIEDHKHGKLESISIETACIDHSCN